MRSLFHFRWLLTLVLGLGSLLAAHATHNRGGDIAYISIASTTVGVPRYHVVVRLFLDVTSPVKQETITLLASQGGCGAASTSSYSVVLNKGLATPGLWLGCGTGSPYEVALYETDLDLPTGQWLLSTTLENRATNIVNVSGSINTTLYFNALLDNTLVSQDTSPKFESVLMPNFNGTRVPPYSFSAFDTDGDSLRYDFVTPQQLVGGVISGNVCSQALPSFQLAPYFTLNNSTGALLPATPSGQQGYYVTAVRVSEYRRLAGQWQLIGYVTRDLTYITASSANQAPAFTSLSVNGGAAQSPDQLIMARPGQTLRLVLTAADPDAGQQLRFASEAPNVVPGLSLTTLSSSQVQLTWQVPATLRAGRYAIPVAVLDDGCPTNASQDRTLVFVVSNTALAARAALPAEATAYPLPFHDQVRFTAGPNQAVLVVDALGRPVARLLSAADGSVQ